MVADDPSERHARGPARPGWWPVGSLPRSSCTWVYALLAVGLAPLADSLTARASPLRRALARLGGALVAAGVIARLFATG
jgi:hypothetical protein